MQIRVADYIADWLAKKKIKHVFTVTGGGAMHLNDAFGKHPKLKCIYNSPRAGLGHGRRKLRKIERKNRARMRNQRTGRHERHHRRAGWLARFHTYADNFGTGSFQHNS